MFEMPWSKSIGFPVYIDLFLLFKLPPPIMLVLYLRCFLGLFLGEFPLDLYGDATDYLRRIFFGELEMTSDISETLMCFNLISTDHFINQER
jgi:hypothetical protein